MGEFVFISESLEDQVASTDSGDDGLDEIKDQMAAQQKQMAQLTELLLAQAQQTQQTQGVKPIDNYPKATPESKKPKKPKQPANMKTASTLSWVFPGMGHYYSGRLVKGVFFTGLELFSIAAIAGTSNEYDRRNDEYQTAFTNMENSGNQGDYNTWKSEAQDALDGRNKTVVYRIAAGTAAVGIWLWNTRDVKKNRSSDYSYNSKYSVGVNRYGRIEARINF